MSSLVGALLVARPTLRDGFFSRTVILMLQHGDEGAFGLVLTHPAKAEGLPFPVFVGGPCEMQGLLMLHGHAEWTDKGDGPGEVCPGVFMGDSDSFEKLSQMPEEADWKFRVFTGYSGWGPKQLEGEMAEGAWIVVPGNGEHLFDTPPDELWEKLAPPTLPEPSLN